MSNRVDLSHSQKSSGKDTAMTDQELTSRRAKSLVEMTKKFLRLLHESEDGILDLKQASPQISFRHSVETKDVFYVDVRTVNLFSLTGMQIGHICII